MMENELTNEVAVSENKVFPYSQFYGAVFLGGPLVGGYMIAENYKAFGEHDKVRATWIVTIAFTVALFCLCFIIGGQKNFPNYIIPILYCSLGAMLMRNLQGKQIDKHLAEGSPKYRWQKTLGVALIGLVITLLIIFTAAIIITLIKNAKGN